MCLCVCVCVCVCVFVHFCSVESLHGSAAHRPCLRSRKEILNRLFKRRFLRKRVLYLFAQKSLVYSRKRAIHIFLRKSHNFAAAQKFCTAFSKACLSAKPRRDYMPKQTTFLQKSPMYSNKRAITHAHTRTHTYFPQNCEETICQKKKKRHIPAKEPYIFQQKSHTHFTQTHTHTHTLTHTHAHKHTRTHTHTHTHTHVL